MIKMDKIRVLHVAEAPGGVERYLVTLLSKMKEYDQFEHILICSDSYDDNKFLDLVTSVEHIKNMHNCINVKNDILSIISIRKMIKKYKPDIVYCHSSKAGALGRVANIGIKNKIFYNAHGWSFNIKGRNNIKIKFYELVERLLSHITDIIICISEYEKESALNHHICKSDKLRVIRNGIDFDEYRDIRPISRTRLNIPENAFVVGTVGRLTHQKSSDIFVEMAALVKKQIPEAFFLMVGDGSERKKIEALVKTKGLSDSFFNNRMDK